MKNTKQKIALASLIILLVVSVVGGLIKPYFNSKNQPPITTPITPSSQGPSSDSVPEKIAIPNFTFYDMEETAVTFDDFKGKPIVINFWATWCGFCKVEMPDFDKLIAEYSEDVTFIMLNATDGQRETKSLVEKYLAEEKFENLVPYLDIDLAGHNVFGITSFPTTAFIDSDGNLYDAIIGPINYDDVKAILDMMVGI